MKTEGICVDTHVHRISNRLQWVNTWNHEKSASTIDIDKTRKKLETLIPKHLWHEINPLLVGFGQQICSARYPSCQNCLLKDVCPSSRIKSNTTKDIQQKII